jgi:hypothetical protein
VCVSNPPIETKKISRWCPSVACCSITFATAFSWFARPPVTPVNAVVIADEPEPCRIGFSRTLEVSAVCIVCWAAPTIWFESGSVRSCDRAAARASCVALPPSPENPKLPPVGSDSERTETPLPNVCEPENDIDIGVAFGALSPTTLSARRPPQPVIFASVALLIVDMNCCCWSLCENRLSGIFFGRGRARYSVRVIGSTSVPTLHRTAHLPTVKRFCSSGIAGCSP